MMIPNERRMDKEKQVEWKWKLGRYYRGTLFDPEKILRRKTRIFYEFMVALGSS